VEVVAGVKRVTSLATDADLASCPRTTGQQNRSPTRARRHVRSPRVIAGVVNPKARVTNGSNLDQQIFTVEGYSEAGSGVGSEKKETVFDQDDLVG